MHQHHPPRVMTQRLTAHLSKSNSLARLLRGLGVSVLSTDLDGDRPSLLVSPNLPDKVPVRGIMRMRIAHNEWRCSAFLNSCEVRWIEYFDDAVLIAPGLLDPEAAA